MKTIKQLFALLTPAERNRAGVLMGMVLVMALLDMLGVASILPFIAVLSNPELAQTNTLLNAAFTMSSRIGVHSIDDFLFVLGVFVFVLLVISLIFKALTTYAQTRFARMREYSIGRRLVEGYLGQPYGWFLSRHSADLGKTILSEVSTVIGGALIPMINLLSQSAVALALLGLLIAVDPRLALSVGLVLGLAYILIFLAMSGWLKRLGQERIRANKLRFTALSEAFGAAKEVKANGLEEVYIKRFAEPAEIYAKGQAAANIIGQVPRFALEAIAFGGMLAVLLYLMSKSGTFASALPVISLYAFAGYRLMPALQQIYGALTQLRFSGPALKALNQDIKSLETIELCSKGRSPLPFNKNINLKDVSYGYPGTSRLALEGVDLSIPANSTVGFVGFTGSGKTTLVDIILGLLEPKKGDIYVDDVRITPSNRRRWQSVIGYVPQTIFISDDSIAANIAFGETEGQINLTAVERAARIANLHQFVMTDLTDGYNTLVGERGVRLSGGQRQRIGLARALYHDPKVLILDEATSALDNLTEEEVMESIKKISGEMTIILIAHRLSTVRECDQLFMLQNGKLTARGSYEDLKNASPLFARMAGKRNNTC